MWQVTKVGGGSQFLAKTGPFRVDCQCHLSPLTLIPNP